MPDERKQPWERTLSDWCQYDVWVGSGQRLKDEYVSEETLRLKDALDYANRAGHPVHISRARKAYQDAKMEDAKRAYGRHREIVLEALREGKAVPAEVLKDYPDLEEETINA